MTNATAMTTVNAINATTITAEQANTIMQYIMSGKAIVIIPDGNILNSPVIVETETAPVKKTRDRELLYKNKLNKILTQNGVGHKVGKGCKKGMICDKTYRTLVKEMLNDRATLRVRRTFEILSDAHMQEEGRGFKHDIVMDIYNRIPKGYYFTEAHRELIVNALKELPLTNDFAEKMKKHMDDGIREGIAIDEVPENKQDENVIGVA